MRPPQVELEVAHLHLPSAFRADDGPLFLQFDDASAHEPLIDAEHSELAAQVDLQIRMIEVGGKGVRYLFRATVGTMKVGQLAGKGT